VSAIGGEWFCMWQSEQWNGVEAAFRFVVIIMLSFLFIAMPEQGGRLKIVSEIFGLGQFCRGRPRISIAHLLIIFDSLVRSHYISRL